ncbi:MAG: hypothetical protein AAF693_00660, partial [Bacteroidota bacterium]
MNRYLIVLNLFLAFSCSADYSSDSWQGKKIILFDSVKLKEEEWPVSYVITPKKITDSLVTFTDLTSRNIIVFNKRGDHVKTVNNDLI